MVARVMKSTGEMMQTQGGDIIQTSGIHPIGVYIRRRKATIAERVACRSIYEVCTEAERRPGTIWLV